VRVCVVVTARPSYSRVRSVLENLTGTDVHLVAAASALVTRFGRVVDEIREDGLYGHLQEIPCMVEGGSVRESAISTGVLLTQISGILAAIRPDVVVTVADRHETLATAIAASYQNIPLCHIQGGEVSGSIDDKVRNAVTQLADIHCVSTQTAARRVLTMRPGARVHQTGCPSIDLAREAMSVGPLPAPDVVVLQHPDTTQPTVAAGQMQETIEAVNGIDALWFWPGADAGGDDISKAMRLAKLHPKRNMRPLTFLRTLLGAKVLVGNSSVGIRECSFMGVPVVNIGARQNGRERGPNVIDVGYNARDIRSAIYAAMSLDVPKSTLYGDGEAGLRIAQILEGE